MSDLKSTDKTHFGFSTVTVQEKTRKVADVFDSVATKYDLMNDVMSLGIHRLWKRFAIDMAGISRGQRVLDIASGTGDLATRIIPLLGKEGGMFVTDINHSMLSLAKRRLIDKGMVRNVSYVLANAEELPFQDNMFDRVIIGFGLRNVTQKHLALQSMFRVLKPGGRLIVLEFSEPQFAVLKQLYDHYSFSVLPMLGKWLVGDAQSYRYLAESIRMHPNQQTLKTMLETAGFSRCDFNNLTGGIVAIHRGFKA